MVSTKLKCACTACKKITSRSLIPTTTSRMIIWSDSIFFTFKKYASEMQSMPSTKTRALTRTITSETTTTWQPYDYFGSTKPLHEIKVLIPECYRDILSLDTTTQARLSYTQYGSQVFRIKIWAMITKIPGHFLYMSYRQIYFIYGQLMTST